MAPTIGIELEMNCDRVVAGEVVCGIVGGVLEPRKGEPLILDPQGRCWQVKDDTSIDAPARQRAELIVPPFFEDELPMVASIVQALRAHASVGRCCGLHVHVSSAGGRREHFAALIERVAALEPLVFERMLAPNPERRPYAAPLSTLPVVSIITSASEDELWARWHDDPRWSDFVPDRLADVRYRGLNLHSHHVRETIEFRYFNASLDPDLVTACTRLCIGLVEEARFPSTEDYS